MRKDLIKYYYQKNQYGFFEVISYIDNSYTDNINNQKSITGYYFFLRGAITTWYSK